ncbi:hypothetical protein [Paenibacillus sp.]|uniref:hypothetical protein n=1 Tax=Paenibacillus sp. TaxID=58172 RepID=UPI002D2B04E0|nr:hypothetical protein [Paenibacillus sp.]HZG83694.1 hypothetical protein [Paenibacillus sp.]
MTRSMASEGMGGEHARATFQALADALIPPMWRTNHAFCARIVPGALHLDIDRYLMMQLDHSQFVPPGAEGAVLPLSISTARLLDMGAEGLPPEGRLFSALPRIDRLLALQRLDRLHIPLSAAPPPFTDNPALIRTIVNSLHQLTLFGYYSEWFGYGTTRLNAPQDRKLEWFPPGWSWSEYPGPSLGYRALRGFVLKYPHRKGETSHG